MSPLSPLFLLSLLLSPVPLLAQINPARIDIVRDSFGVPHIFAPTDAEVAYGLAWAHCEDDFETVQDCFLAAKGLLGRTAGKDGAAVDFVVQAIRAREFVQANYEKSLSPDFKRLIRGYCDGFNRYAAAHPREVRHRALLPLTPEDMGTYLMLQMFVFTGGDLALSKLVNNKTAPAKFVPALHGSNAFAFNSRKTADGDVYLAINSHQPWEGPVAWYEAHLCSEEGWNIVGGLFPGSPCILVGANEYLGWGHTVNNPDKLDVYQLEIDPKDKNRYRVDGEWLTLEEKTIRLKVKIAGVVVPVRKKAWWSLYGPTFRNKTGTFALRSTGLFDLRALEEWYRMNKAHTFTEFYQALKMEAIPGFNVVYADRYDTIYYLSNAKMPVRAPGYDWTGTLPGNTRRTLWTEFYPLEKLPQLLNPAAGFVYNTNNTPFSATARRENLDPADFDATMGYECYENNRSRRFMELVEPHDKITYDQFRRIKYDRQLPARIDYACDIDCMLQVDPDEYPDLKPLIDTLRHWDRRSEVTSVGATQFLVTIQYIAKAHHLATIYEHHVLTPAEAVDALRHTHRYLLRHFGRLDVPLGEYQRLVRGNVDRPLWGLPDVLAAVYSFPDKKGRVRGAVGDSYIELVRFTPNGPVIESCNVYGASNRPGTRHYADQASLFLEQRTRPMPLEKKRVYAMAERVYHPE